MSWRKKVNLKSKNVKVSFANWLSQVSLLIMPRFFYIIAGRGSAKTTDLQVDRLIEMAYDMPGAPVCWISDTYSNLTKNVLQTVVEGLALKGYYKDVHYVIGKAPPTFTEAEKVDLPPNIREHFWKPYNQMASYKHTMIWFTGLNVTYASLDRPASLAGRNYVHVFGDEVKYFKPERVSNLLKALRGFRLKYGNSVFYRGHTFTTDMPNTDRIGEYDWILKQSKRMSSKAIGLVIKLGLVVNEAVQEYIAACEAGDTEEKIKKHRTWNRWTERWISARLQKSAHTFYFVASSLVNIDILTPEWLTDALAADFDDTKTAIFSMKPELEAGERFYANINERHFYHDGNDPIWSERFGLNEKEDCRILKYLDKNKALEGGADFGNMMSLCVAQPSDRLMRVLKFHYTLSPQWIRQLADEFIRYYKPHKEKVLNLFYDRAANNYKKAGQDLATQLKKAIEKDAEGKRTGWTVVLMSEGQGNIGINEEYNFMQETLSGGNRKLPKVLIDYFNCKPLRCSLQDAKTQIDAKGKTAKDKRSEKLAIKRLPLESTNPSDSFKYLMMRKHWRRLVRGAKKPYTGDAGTV
ncbi:MAG: hypothetical protein RIC03_12525 [Cyclobacteriaceae bacterium]